MIVVGRTSRSVDGWNERIALAETLNAKVITDLKCAAGFPTDHPLHAGVPAGNAMTPEAAAALKAADVILALDCVDLNGVLRGGFGFDVPKPKIINVSADFHLHNGWSMDYEALPPVDLLLVTTSEQAVSALLASLGGAKAPKPAAVKPKAEPYKPSDGPLRVDDLALALKSACGDHDVTLTHLPLSWNGATWDFRHPLDYIGSDGGGGIGSGPGLTVGAALALKGSNRLVVGVCGDGDYMMGATAVWTAVHYKLPRADRGLQQPLVLQRRTAPGTRRPRPQPAGGKPLDRSAHLRARHRLLGGRAGAGCGRLPAGHQDGRPAADL